MTNEEAREILTSIEIQSYRDVSKRWFFTDVNEAFGIAIKALQKQENNFNEVVDFFNDIMDTFYKELSAYDVSSESVRYARNIVYDVFSRRYRIKEIENGKSETIQEV